MAVMTGHPSWERGTYDLHWHYDRDIDWDRFDRTKVDPDVDMLVRAASMVEYNSPDYVTYLENVFHDDPAFVEAARQWGYEERQHGKALGKWAELVDPDFDHEARFDAFTDGFRPNVDATASIRGSRAGELVARCMVEVGTSSYYTALSEATDEPVLKQICQKIAADEFRHYKLFYDHMRRWLEHEHLSKYARLRVALGRIHETEDDELSYAFYAANTDMTTPYDRKRYNDAYAGRAFRYYRPAHVDRALSMVFKASGFKPGTSFYKVTARGAKWIMERKQSSLARYAADARQTERHAAAA